MPRCDGALVYDDIHFAGTPILVECHCSQCHVAYLLDWPAGHALLYPTIVEVETGVAHSDGREWYPRLLRRLIATREHPTAARTDVRGHSSGNSTAIVVNCIDFLYGHCVLKVLSGLRYARDPDVDVVMVVQKNVSWLVPSTVDIVIEVNVPLSGGDTWIAGLDSAVTSVVEGYEFVQIAPTPSQPYLTNDDLADIAPRLAPSAFWNSPNAGLHQIALLLREDRLWSGRRRAGALRLLPRDLTHQLMVRAQTRNCANVVRQVQRRCPNVQFVAIGLGRSHPLPTSIRDLRTTTITQDTERDWLTEYARSRVVVGVHGSHMLLPSAFAGAVIDLLPPHKLPNIAQDLIVISSTEPEPKLSLFRYRILPDNVGADVVSEVIVSLLEDADFHYVNMIRNRSATGVEWLRPIVWRRLDDPAA